MRGVCGIDAGISTGRKYSTMEDNSSITAMSHNNLNFDDECRISLSRFTKKVKGREVRYIQAKATLIYDEVDEAHDLFYLVRVPDASNVTTARNRSPVETYGMRANQENVKNENNQSVSITKAAISGPQIKDGQNSNENSSQNQNWRQTQPQKLFKLSNEADSGLNLKYLSSEDIKKKASGVNELINLSSGQQPVDGNHPLQAIANGPTDFVCPNGGSFTFHPSIQTGEAGNKSTTQTHNSSKPNLMVVSDVLGAHQNVVISPQKESSSVEKPRYDTETFHQRDENIDIEINDEKSKMTSFTGNMPRDGSAINIGGGISSSSSQRLMERNLGIAVAPGKRLMPRRPQTYADLDKKYIVKVKRDRDKNLTNVAVGSFPLSKVPDGNYYIYYYRPKNRNRMIGASRSSTAQDKIQRVGKGIEFYIFDKNNTSSQSPSKQSGADSLHHSIVEMQGITQSVSHASIKEELTLRQHLNPLGQVTSHTSNFQKQKSHLELLHQVNNRQNLLSAPNTAGGHTGNQIVNPEIGIQEHYEESKSGLKHTAQSLYHGNSMGLRQYGGQVDAMKVKTKTKETKSPINGQSNPQDVTPKNNLGRKLVNWSEHVSPDEVDALVCLPPESQETDKVSKAEEDSCSTEKVRRENLGQRVLRQNLFVRETEMDEDQDERACASHESGQASSSNDMMTFGYNSTLHGAVAPTGQASTNGQPFMSQSTSNLLQSANTLAGLQEVYQVHNAQVFGSANVNENLESAQSNKNRIDQPRQSFSSTSQVAKKSEECPDTPNLYQTMTHASHQTHSVEISVTTDGGQLSQKPPTCEGKVPKSSKGLTMTQPASQAIAYGKQGTLSFGKLDLSEENKVHPKAAPTYPDSFSSSIKIEGDGSNELNVVNQHLYQSIVNPTLNDYNISPLIEKENSNNLWQELQKNQNHSVNGLQRQSPTRKKNTSAIRVERQGSYSRSNSSYSDNTGGLPSSNQPKQGAQGGQFANDVERSEDYRLSDSNSNVPSAFEAAEVRVQNSKVQRSKHAQNNSSGTTESYHEIESVDNNSLVPSQIPSGGHLQNIQERSFQGRQEIDGKSNNHGDSKTNQINQMQDVANKVSPEQIAQFNPCNKNDRTSAFQSYDENQKLVHIGLNDDIDSQPIEILQLFDTRGPLENCPQAKNHEEMLYSNSFAWMANVVGGVSSSHDQPVGMTQVGAFSAQTLQAEPALYQQKHKRAIANDSEALQATNSNNYGTMSPSKRMNQNSNCYSADQVDDFHSPDKTAITEAFQSGHSQNENAINFEQISRNKSGSQGQNNQGPYRPVHGYSDRKQLSTVEEENASQCSDMTSVHQHTQSRFLLTNHSSLSRKSVRNSVQLVGGPPSGAAGGNLHPQPALGTSQYGYLSSSGKKATSFCISEEEASEGSRVIQNADIMIEEGPQDFIIDQHHHHDRQTENSHNHQRKDLQAIRKNSNDEHQSDEDTEERVKICLPHSSYASVSNNSTKANSLYHQSIIVTSPLVNSNQALSHSQKAPNQLFRSLHQKQQMNSDYYILKRVSPILTQDAQAENIGVDDQNSNNSASKSSTSSLMDLDHGVQNAALPPGSALLPQTQVQEQKISTQTNGQVSYQESDENQNSQHFLQKKVIKSSSPYMLALSSPHHSKEGGFVYVQANTSGTQGDLRAQACSGFRGTSLSHNVGDNSSQERSNVLHHMSVKYTVEDQSCEKMIDSVHLSCSEKVESSQHEVIEEEDSVSRDSVKLVQLIEKVSSPNETPKIKTVERQSTHSNNKNVTITSSEIGKNQTSRDSAKVINSSVKQRKQNSKQLSTSKISAQGLTDQSQRNSSASKETKYLVSPGSLSNQQKSQSKARNQKSSSLSIGVKQGQGTQKGHHMTPQLTKSSSSHNTSNSLFSKKHPNHRAINNQNNPLSLKSLASPFLQTTAVTTQSKTKKVEVSQCGRKLKFTNSTLQASASPSLSSEASKITMQGAKPDAATQSASQLLLSPNGQAKLVFPGSVSTNSIGKTGMIKSQASSNVSHPPQPLLRQKEIMGSSNSLSRKNNQVSDKNNNQQFLKALQIRPSKKQSQTGKMLSPQTISNEKHSQGNQNVKYVGLITPKQVCNNNKMSPQTNPMELPSSQFGNNRISQSVNSLSKLLHNN